MPRRRHSAEEITPKLRQTDVLLAQGQTGAEVAPVLGVTEIELRNELRNVELFYSLREAKFVIEQWRRHYNTIRLHSSLGYRAPAPEVFILPAEKTAALRPSLN